MSFNRTTWVDDVTETSAANFNRIEQGIADLHGRRLVYDGVWSQAAPLVIPGLSGDTEGPYRIIVAGRLNTGGGADLQLQLALLGTAPGGGAEVRGNSRNMWIESYQSADGSYQPPQNNNALNDNHLFLAQVRWSEANEITTDLVLACKSSFYPTTTFHSTNKPAATLDARNMHAQGSGFLYHPRNVTSMQIAPSVGGSASLSGRVVVEKLGLA